MLETDEFSGAWIKKSIKVNDGDMKTTKKLVLMQYKGGKHMDNTAMDHLDQKVTNTFLPQTVTFGGAGQRMLGAQGAKPIQ